MKNSLESVTHFLILYFMYYYMLRFVQCIFQMLLTDISTDLCNIVYKIGTPMHEVAHLIAAICVGAKIKAIKLIPKKGETGYVEYEIKGKSRILICVREFIIAIAPAILNICLFIFIEFKYVLRGQTIIELMKILNPLFWFSINGVITFCLFIICISCIAPSYQDLKGMTKGVCIFSIIIFLAEYIMTIDMNISFVYNELLGNVSLMVVVYYYFEIIILLLVLNLILKRDKFVKNICYIINTSIRNIFAKN